MRIMRVPCTQSPRRSFGAFFPPFLSSLDGSKGVDWTERSIFFNWKRASRITCKSIKRCLKGLKRISALHCQKVMYFNPSAQYEKFKISRHGHFLFSLYISKLGWLFFFTNWILQICECFNFYKLNGLAVPFFSFNDWQVFMRRQSCLKVCIHSFNQFFLLCTCIY